MTKLVFSHVDVMYVVELKCLSKYRPYINKLNLNCFNTTVSLFSL